MRSREPGTYGLQICKNLREKSVIVSVNDLSHVVRSSMEAVYMYSKWKKLAPFLQLKMVCNMTCTFLSAIIVVSASLLVVAVSSSILIVWPQSSTWSYYKALVAHYLHSQVVLVQWTVIMMMNV